MALGTTIITGTPDFLARRNKELKSDVVGRSPVTGREFGFLADPSTSKGKAELYTQLFESAKANRLPGAEQTLMRRTAPLLDSLTDEEKQGLSSRVVSAQEGAQQPITPEQRELLMATNRPVTETQAQVGPSPMSNEQFLRSEMGIGSEPQGDGFVSYGEMQNRRVNEFIRSGGTLEELRAQNLAQMDPETRSTFTRDFNETFVGGREVAPGAKLSRIRQKAAMGERLTPREMEALQSPPVEDDATGTQQESPQSQQQDSASEPIQIGGRSFSRDEVDFWMDKGVIEPGQVRAALGIDMSEPPAAIANEEEEEEEEVPTITTQEAYESLPNGAVYRGPDGKEYTKQSGEEGR